MFLTTFDGSSIQYIDAFVRVVPTQIEALYAGARGFPGSRRFRPVARYIADHMPPGRPRLRGRTRTRRRRRSPRRSSCATASPRSNAASRALSSDERFAREWERFLTEVQDLV